MISARDKKYDQRYQRYYYIVHSASLMMLYCDGVIIL